MAKKLSQTNGRLARFWVARLTERPLGVPVKKMRNAINGHQGIYQVLDGGDVGDKSEAANESLESLKHNETINNR